MKLSALKAFVTAIEEGSLRAAARRLHLSQPAVTKMVRELELELCAKLLTRTTMGVVATAQGQALHARAINVGKELNAAVDEINNLGGTFTGELAVGAVPMAVILLLPEAMRTFGQEFPDVLLKFSEELFFAQLQKLRAGEVDIAVCGIPDGLPTGEFLIEKLITTSTVVVVNKQSPHARKTTLRDLSAAKWAYAGSPGASGYVPLLFAKHGMPPPPVGAVVNSTLALLSLVIQGDLVGLLPRQIAMHPLLSQYLTIVPIAEAGITMALSAVVRNDSAASPTIRHFIAHLHRAAHRASMDTGL